MMGKSKHQPTRQDLLNSGLNVFAIDLLAESFLKREGMENMEGIELEFFFPVNRSDCGAFSGINIVLEVVLK